MKKLALCLLLTLVLGLTANAQNIAVRPTLVSPNRGSVPAQGEPSPASETLPSLCTPCVFYGGDNNPNDPNSQDFAYGNAQLVPDSSVYAAVDIPKSVHGVITGILFMALATESGNDFDPATAPYDIRTGVSSGNGGKSVASGSNTLSFAPYISTSLGTIYEIAVNLTTPFTVTPGTRYWFSEVPQCTNSEDSTCSILQYFFPNTTQEANGLSAAAQPPYEMFANSANFGRN
jgi:hypothetical protein